MGRELKMEVTSVFDRNYDAYMNPEYRFIWNQGGSRCHSKDTLIRMYDGRLKKVQDIVIGDKVANWNGIGYSTVINLDSGITDMYKITQNKGIDYIVTSNHILCLRQNSPKYKKTYPTNEKNPWGYGLKPYMIPIEYDEDKIHYYTAEEWSKISGREKRRFSGFKNTYLELPKKDLSIDPYYLGLWLGDGTSNRGGQITNIDEEIVNYLNEFNEIQGDSFLYKDGLSYTIRHKEFNKQTNLSKNFYELNLIRNKHIPDDYIYGDYEDRLKVLAGLIDSDGGLTGRNTYSITQKSEKIILGIKEILDISGFYTRGIRKEIAKMKRKDGSYYECLVFSIEFNHHDFNDLCKYIKVNRKKIIKNTSSKYMFNTKIESTYIGKGEYYGFTLDNPEPLYKLEDGTITHNSSKSISILQLLIIIALQEKKKITICRKTLTACKQIIEDFFNLLNEYDLYESGTHNKMDKTFTFYNGSVIEFIGVDNDLKLRGMKRDILFCNEVNELDFDEWLQLNLRTSGKIICDFNPSDAEHFIYPLMRERNSIVIKSTYKDNPFLTKEQVEYIEGLIKTDESYYKVYVLGEVPTATTRVYNHFKQFIDEPVNIDTIIYGLDIGFNHPSALVECKFIDNRVYVKELIYERNLTSVDLINRIKIIGIDKNRDFYVDSARPDIIEDLRRNGFYKARGADKEVVEGIDSVKSMEVFIHHESINLWKEYKLYSWKSNGDIISDKEVVKEMDDLCLDENTLIVTNEGMVKIKDIIPYKHYVMTSQGYEKVLSKFNNGLKKIVKYKIILENGQSINISATENHLIKINENEWTEICKLKEGMMVYYTKCIKEKNINSMRVEDTLCNTQTTFTTLFGKNTMGKEEKDFIYTTKMETATTTGLRILKKLMPSLTYQHTQKKDLLKTQSFLESSNKQELNLQKNGIKVKRVESGIDNTQKSSIGEHKHMESQNVSIVVRHIQKKIQHKDFVFLNVKQQIEEKKELTMKLEFVDVENNSQPTNIVKQKIAHVLVESESIGNVYDLEVENIHEYFANGILVHNCDSMRYAIHSYKKNKKVSKRSWYIG